MPVAELAVLASYTVLMAAELDPLLIGGLDLAIYRDSSGIFEFADSGSYRVKAEKLDEEIRNAFRQLG
jgi:hypothetical protein